MKTIYITLISVLLLGNLTAVEGTIVMQEQKPDSTLYPVRVFDDIESDYMVARIFFSNKQKKNYKKLDDEGKRDFLDEFWADNDLNPVTENNEFIEVLADRINYCNTFFSHFKDGWTTDRGRIYIKYGPPYEKYKDKTEIYSKYGTKDFEIWKYRLDHYMTFIFIDIQTHGDYRLIFSDGDDSESSLPDWRDYLGDNFDDNLLY
ncbi:MAG: GWxTD domain-containing protein [Candidatus Cloacimonetes bacterium]|nr:GWxTD domain-containing protein [Candidatus Cloacimonadota bacterium]